MPTDSPVDHAPASLSNGNHLLDRVPSTERARFADRLTPVSWEAGEILYQPDQPQTHVYFPVSGMLSLVSVMRDGRLAEVGVIGREGAAGMSASGYVDRAFTRLVGRIPGSGYRVAAADFEDMIDESVGLCSAVVRWREVMLRMTVQSVACNALHQVRERCARWILATHDRSEDNQLSLTQEFLAELLGVKRNAINIAARDLQQQGIIEYRRGRVAVIDRDGLEQVSCECYGLIRAEIAKLFADGPSPECDD